MISTLCNLLFRVPLLFSDLDALEAHSDVFQQLPRVTSTFLCAFSQSQKLLLILLLSVDGVLNTDVFVFSEAIKHRAHVLVVVPEYETTPHMGTRAHFFYFDKNAALRRYQLGSIYLPTNRKSNGFFLVYIILKKVVLSFGCNCKVSVLFRYYLTSTNVHCPFSY